MIGWVAQPDGGRLNERAQSDDHMTRLIQVLRFLTTHCAGTLASKLTASFQVVGSDA